jgi:hypothetical protein
VAAHPDQPDRSIVITTIGRDSRNSASWSPGSGIVIRAMAEAYLTRGRRSDRPPAKGCGWRSRLFVRSDTGDPATEVEPRAHQREVAQSLGISFGRGHYGVACPRGWARLGSVDTLSATRCCRAARTALHGKVRILMLVKRNIVGKRGRSPS